MEIRDVIGNLRLADLEIIRRLDALRLDMHLLTYRLDELEKSSCATESAVSTKEDASGTTEAKPELPPTRPSATQARVGAKRAGRKSDLA